MDQAIAGVTPATQQEVTVMTVWPSIAIFGVGRFLGLQFANQAGVYVLTVGNLIALASIPLALALYFLRVGLGIRYRITNRRILNERGIQPKEFGAVDLDRFDTIEIVVQPGQAWYDAGDLVFRQGNLETFRLPGVSRPDSFRATCMKARDGFVGVKRALEREHLATA